MGAKLIEDDKCQWHGVSDPKERKRIQDRLAQRARRKKLAESRPRQRSSSSITTPTLSPASSPASSEDSGSSACPAPSRISDNGESWVLVPLVEREDRVLSHVPTSVFAALFNNGAMLGLECGCLVPSKSNPCGSDIPEPLRPTALQLTTLHQPWIDRFPFPRMRDNMIGLNRIFNEEQFLRDLFSMHSFTIKSGGDAWDPRSWSIGREFSQKWGYLFY